MYLITGGSGFIGSHFHQVLPHDSFVNLDLQKPSFRYASKFVQGDIRVEDDIRKAVDGNNINTIISLAAKHHDFGIGHDEYFDTNEEGTRILCKVATDYQINKIVFYSSVAVYGISENISTEASTPKPDSPYGRSKLAGEKVLEQWATESNDRKVLIIRPTLVFGPNNMANMRNLIKQIDSGLYFHLGEASNVKSIAYVENVVAATLYLLESIKVGVSIYNYSDTPQLTTRQIGETIAKSLGRRIHLTVPRTLGIMMGLPFDLIIKLTGINLPVSSARIKKLGTSTHHSAEKIFSEGFKPTFTTIQGLEKMVQWYQQLKK